LRHDSSQFVANFFVRAIGDFHQCRQFLSDGV
jgi:hypothetical protein